MQPILSIENLTICFESRIGQSVTVVDGVSLQVAAGKTLGIVGESGCGKSTLLRGVLRLIPHASGQVTLNGQSVLDASPRELHDMRRRMQMVFQDPNASLNPRWSVAALVGEGLDIHAVGSRTERRLAVAHMLDAVGLSRSMGDRYPHELSGGQRQRVAIARALVLRPQLLILDEPVSALDASVQSQILNLLSELQLELGFGCIFVGHHLGVMRHVAHDVAVMYLGRVVEFGSGDCVLTAPRHPYTQALLMSVVEPGEHAGRLPPQLPGEPASPARRPSGCAFHPRCPVAVDRCSRELPILTRVGNAAVACHLAAELSADSVESALSGS